MTTETPNTKMWTTNELAKRANCDPSNIRKAIARGKLTGEKIGRDWFISDQEARRWLSERQTRL